MSTTVQPAVKPSAKRHLWLISLTYPTLPLLGLSLALAFDVAAWVWLTAAIVYVLMPTMDAIIGDDTNDLLGLIED
ncbi:MAG: hypothetical protein AAFP97_01245, partial [Pseudomonadota bacterium]